MTTLVFGKTGQVANALQRQADVVALGRADADLTDAATCAAAIRTHAPKVVINAAAYTAVDAAEDNEDTAMAVNGRAPTAMAQTCAELGIPFVHISTDYVFNGSGTKPWQTDAETGPLGAYGRTKLAGEVGVRAAGGAYVILRTAWVFSEDGNNFVKTMLRLSETRDALNVVEDQIGGPTDAYAIATACLSIATQLQDDPSKSGTFHFAGQPTVSWAEFARAIFTTAERNVTVAGIPASEYPTPAVRPSNSRLDCSTLNDVFGIPAHDWQTGLDRVLAALG